MKAQKLSYCAGLWKADGLDEALWAEMRRRGIDTVHEDVEVVIGDGAAWIWDLAQTHYPYGVQIMDWYHAEGRLWGVGKVVCGQGKERTKEWVEGRLDQLWDEALSGVRHQLKATSLGSEGGGSSSSGLFHHWTLDKTASKPSLHPKIGLVPQKGS